MIGSEGNALAGGLAVLARVSGGKQPLELLDVSKWRIWPGDLEIAMSWPVGADIGYAPAPEAAWSHVLCNTCEDVTIWATPAV